MLFGSGRLKKLEEEVAKLKRMVEERDLDWVDMRARCKRLLDRTEKSARQIKPEEEESNPAEDVGNGVGATATGRSLTPHQMSVQQQILRRRAGGG